MKQLGIDVLVDTMVIGHEKVSWVKWCKYY